MRKHPELAYALITEGTWDYGIVDELAPRADEIVARKSCYSGLAGTNLDQALRARRIRDVVFRGVAANVCMKTTLRDPYHHEYFPSLVRDATRLAGPSTLLDATIWNVERFFGWTATAAEVQAALAMPTAEAA